MEERKLKRLERNGKTKECIAKDQIKQWIEEMHIYQQRHLKAYRTWFRCSQGKRWWPTMEICKIQHYIMYDCPSCWNLFPNKPRNIICGSITVQSHNSKNWRRLLTKYLTYGYLKGPHISKGQHKKIVRHCRKYFNEERKFKRILSNGDVKICIAGREINEYLKELHVTESDEHLREERMWHLIMFGPHWWPTCGAYIISLCRRKCTVCSNQAEFSKDQQIPSHVDQKDPPRTTTDWKQPYMEYLTCEEIFDKTLSPEVKRAVTQSDKYFVFTNGNLQRIRKGGKSNQVCISETHVPRNLAKVHGESEPNLAAIDTWKAVATGAYRWPTWGKDVCNHLRYCMTCRDTEAQGKHLEGSQDSFLPISEPDWRQPITQRLNSYEELNHVGTHEDLGLLNLDAETYFITEDGLKYRLQKSKSRCA